MIQRVDHRHRGQKSVAGVTEAGQCPDRLAAARHAAVLVLNAGQAGAGLVIAGQACALAPFEATRVAIDQVRLELLETLIVDLEALGRVVAHVVMHDISLFHQFQQDLHRPRVLEIQGDALLAAIGHVGDMHAVPEQVVEPVDLDDIGAKIGQQLRPERAGDGQAQVQHGDAFQRRLHRLSGCRRSRRRPALRDDARRLGLDAFGVLAGHRRMRARRALRSAHVVGIADRSYPSQVGIFGLDHAAIGQKRRIGQRFLDGSHVLHGHAGLARRLHPFLRRELGHGLGKNRLVVRHHQQLFRTRAEAVRIVLHREVRRGIKLVAGRGGHDETRIRHPVVNPAPVGTLEMALGRLGTQYPGIEARGVDVLGAHPHPGATRHRPLQQRGLHELSSPRGFARAQRCGNTDRGREKRAETGPVRGRKQGAGTRCALHPVIRNLQVRERIFTAQQVIERAFRPAALFPVQARTRGNQRIVRGTIGMLVVAPVAGDRAVDQAWIYGRETRVVDTEALRHTGRETFDDDIGLTRQSQKARLVIGILEIQFGALLAAIPDLVAKLAAKRITTGRFDLGHLGAVVRQQHCRHRTGHPPGQIEHADVFENSCHGCTFSLLSLGDPPHG